MAEENGLLRYEVTGETYRHLVFERKQQGETLFVFIEGDGTPWINGKIVATDPTPKSLLAFGFMLQTEAPSIYMGRPCYFELDDPQCSGSDWTHGRFSRPVVNSMAAVVAGFAETDQFSSVVLIGHSGGGALAMLIAPHVRKTSTVITVAGLVDTDTWVQHHGYEALDLSLNPAGQDLLAGIEQIHLVGEKDNVVPAEHTIASTRGWQNVSIWRYSQFDHSCCWQEQWPALFDRIKSELK